MNKRRLKKALKKCLAEVHGEWTPRISSRERWAVYHRGVTSLFKGKQPPHALTLSMSMEIGHTFAGSKIFNVKSVWQLAKREVA